MMDDMRNATPLKGLKNLGPTIIKRLNAIEIFSREDLQRAGRSQPTGTCANDIAGRFLPATTCTRLKERSVASIGTR